MQAAAVRPHFAAPELLALFPVALPFPGKAIVMAKKSKASTTDLAAVEELMQDLETRLRSINSKPKGETASGADDIADFVSGTLARIAGQVRDTAGAATDKLASEASEASTDIIKKVWQEMERRPMTTLALAAAAGYLLGLIGRDKAE